MVFVYFVVMQFAGNFFTHQWLKSSELLKWLADFASVLCQIIFGQSHRKWIGYVFSNFEFGVKIPPLNTEWRQPSYTQIW